MTGDHQAADPGVGRRADESFRPRARHAVALSALWVVVIVLAVAVDLTK